MSRFLSVWTACCLAGATGASCAGETNQPPRFDEVLQIVKSNLAGVSDSDLNRAAVQGLLSQFPGQLALVEAGGDSGAVSAAASITRTNTFDECCGYVRVAAVGGGLAEQVKAAFKTLQSNSAVKGLILDLRYASGVDYTAAAQTADLFLSQERTLLAWNDQTAKSTVKADAIRMPLVALVNAQTKGAAEALALLLKNEGIGLLIGSTTAGQAAMFKDFPLGSGQKLRIAATQILAGDGKAIPARGISPDIAVTVEPKEEQDYYADAFLNATNKLASASRDKTVTGSSTNRPARHRINEAELVRAQKEGQNPDEDTPSTVPKESQPQKPFVRDPALARALDLLKGLIVVRRIGQG